MNERTRVNRNAFIAYLISYLLERGYDDGLANLVGSNASYLFINCDKSAWKTEQELRHLLHDLYHAGVLDSVPEEIFYDVTSQISSFYGMSGWGSIEEDEEDDV